MVGPEGAETCPRTPSTATLTEPEVLVPQPEAVTVIVAVPLKDADQVTTPDELIVPAEDGVRAHA